MVRIALLFLALFATLPLPSLADSDTATQTTCADTSIRIERPSHSPFAMPAVLASDQFIHNLHNYSRPPICTMVMCGGSCAGRADACGAFSGDKVLDLDRLGCLVSERSCGDVNPHASSCETGTSETHNSCCSP